MLKLYDGGAYMVNGTELITDEAEVKAKTGRGVSKEEARTQTMAYGILEAHNISGNMERLQIKFDKLTSHDITFVGIIQTDLCEEIWRCLCTAASGSYSPVCP